jgi:hypothetical protein
VLVRFYLNPYELRGIEGVSILNKSKFISIRINPLQSIWIENNRTSPKKLRGSRFFMDHGTCASATSLQFPTTTFTASGRLCTSLPLNPDRSSSESDITPLARNNLEHQSQRSIEHISTVLIWTSARIFWSYKSDG